MCRTSTVFEMAVEWEGVVTRYVYTRRGLMGGTTFGVATTSEEEQQQPVMIYQASDLLWDDGYAAVRALIIRPPAGRSRMQPGFQVSTAWHGLK